MKTTYLKTGKIDFYKERTDRNIGWITVEEQEKLKNAVIGIAGCGGMGGHLAEQLLRLGVGEIRIADNEKFDASNINRQYGAAKKSLGKQKAGETARKLREISDDIKIKVFSKGIGQDNAGTFIEGCDLICDEIEFWAVGSRIILHQKAREQNTPVFNGNAIGFGLRLFLFTADSATMEEVLEMNMEEAVCLQEKIKNKNAGQETIKRVMGAVIKGLAPEIPQYFFRQKSISAMLKTLSREGRASVLGPTVAMATGFMANRILLYLLESSTTKREYLKMPKMPAYLFFDAASMQAYVVNKKWW